MSYQEKAMSEKQFLGFRRDIMFAYPQYLERFEDEIETFEIVASSLSDRDKVAQLPPDKPMVASRRRAWDSVEHLHIQYSAGVEIERIEKFFLEAIDFWEDYAHYDEAFDSSPDAPYIVAHLTLQDASYWKAIRLTSFAILLGHTDTLGRLCAIWDYGDQTLDGLLERLAAPYVPGRAPPPDTCTRHLPYFKLLKVFAAEPAKRPALMAKYMDEWYEASRREPYYRSHTKGREHSYLGYWSFEAAAVTIVLGIDDSSYRDKDFYPKDLADFARSRDAARARDDGPNDATSPSSMRCEAGQPCPRAGWWFTPARTDSRRHFAQGEVMPEVGGDYGATIWQWASRQD